MSAPKTATADDLASINLAHPATHTDNDLSGVWRLLRTSMPVYWHPETDSGPGFWVVSRHSDVSSIYRDNDRFTSEKGNVLTTLLQGGDTAAGKMLAVTDGRRHSELRNVLLKAFSPRALDRVADRARQTTQRRIREAVERGEFDFATGVAEHIPMGTICDLLGVPESDRSFLLRLTKSALSSEDPTETYTDAWVARNEILMYFAQLADERRHDPQDDVITALATATIGGETLTPHEVILNCYSLILGGDETSRLSMTGAVHAFTEYPDQWLALKQSEVEMRTAVEEVLRWTTPAMHFGRVAQQDVLLHEQLVKKGDVVTLWNCSANRDEEVFAQPYTYDLARTPNKHVAFGLGPHFCLGAYLARVEINALLASLREFVDRIELSGPIRRIHSNLLSGISQLPVIMTPSNSSGLRTV